MSSAIFPSLIGLGWDAPRTSMWNNLLQENVSGKRTAIANWSYPRYQWDLSWDLLRSDVTHHELQDLHGFFEARRGNFDTFLFTDPDDNTVTAQAIATGDGATRSFQLQRAFGGVVSPVFAPNVVSHAYVNGVDPTGWSVTAWGAATPGVITFVSAPANGTAITADFTFYFPCRFKDQQMAFTKFMFQLWSSKVSIQSEK